MSNYSSFSACPSLLKQHLARKLTVPSTNAPELMKVSCGEAVDKLMASLFLRLELPRQKDDTSLNWSTKKSEGNKFDKWYTVILHVQCGLYKKNPLYQIVILVRRWLIERLDPAVFPVGVLYDREIARRCVTLVIQLIGVGTSTGGDLRGWLRFYRNWFLL